MGKISKGEQDQICFSIYDTPSGPYFKKQLTFLVHCVSDVSTLYLQ
jgi:hypothetical protein